MNCLHCNKPIESQRSTKKYCSKTCKQYAYLQRNLGLAINKPTEIENRDLESHMPEHTVSETEDNISVVVDKDPNKKLGLSQLYRLKKEVSDKDREYIHIWPDMLCRLQDAQIALDINPNYFRSSTYGSRITKENLPAMSFVLPRLRCIIENIFFISHKRKVYYKTIKYIFLALQQTIFSDQMKVMPKDFPFMKDLFTLYDGLEKMEMSLKGDKEGIKFSLSKNNTVSFILFLGLIRSVVDKIPFTELFPELVSKEK